MPRAAACSRWRSIPAELEKIQKNPALLPSAIEEILRWTSPIIHFARTATQDVEIHGKRIRKGDQLALFYPSANRDEDVFDDPFTFRVDRDPNRHLAFGIGEHFCAGAHVARLELEVAFKYAAPASPAARGGRAGVTAALESGRRHQASADPVQAGARLRP